MNEDLIKTLAKSIYYGIGCRRFTGHSYTGLETYLRANKLCFWAMF